MVSLVPWKKITGALLFPTKGLKFDDPEVPEELPKVPVVFVLSSASLTSLLSSMPPLSQFP